MNKAIEVFLTQLFPEHILLREIFLFSFWKRWFHSNLLVVQGPNLQILTFWKKKRPWKKTIEVTLFQTFGSQLFLILDFSTGEASELVGKLCSAIHLGHILLLVVLALSFTFPFYLLTLFNFKQLCLSGRGWRCFMRMWCSLWCCLGFSALHKW